MLKVKVTKVTTGTTRLKIGDLVFWLKKGESLILAESDIVGVDLSAMGLTADILEEESYLPTNKKLEVKTSLKDKLCAWLIACWKRIRK